MFFFCFVTDETLGDSQLDLYNKVTVYCLLTPLDQDIQHRITDDSLCCIFPNIWRFTMILTDIDEAGMYHK